jgi:hypothetical protein
MKLFHGGLIGISSPRILASQRLLDFGKGFYTTTNRGQAENLALIKKRRAGKDSSAIVSVYEIDKQLLKNGRYTVHIFTEANEEWLDFIISNRTGSQIYDYDIVKGAVANDTLYATFSLFESGLLTKSETIARLKVHKLFDQISLHTQKVLDELEFIESYAVVFRGICG